MSEILYNFINNYVIVFYILKRENPVKRTVLMVILNALIGLILKLASVYPSIFDLYYFISGLDLPDIVVDNLFNFIIICSKDNACFLIEKFGNLFYLISLSIYLIFFYHFDKNFRISFLRLFKGEKKNTKKNAVKTS